MGIEHLSVLRQRYGHVVLPATIRVESARVSAGCIEHSSPFIAVELALADDAEPEQAAEVQAFANHLAAAGIDVQIRSDELTMMWGKLCFLAPLALLTTHQAVPAGIVRTMHRQKLLVAVDEVVAVAAAAGARVDAASVLQLFDNIPATMQSSMQRDAAAGRSTEIDAIGGAIVRAAERLNVEIPLTVRLVADLRSRERDVLKAASHTQRAPGNDRA